MTLPKPLRALAAVLVVLFVLVVAGMIFLGQRDQGPASGKRLEQTLARMEQQNLHAAGLAMGDLYGTEWVDGISVCAGTPAAVMEKAGVDPKLVKLQDGQVPEDLNYIVLASREGEFKAVELDRKKVDLCMTGQMSKVNPLGIAPFLRKDHTWYLAG